jgi:hypothetical protein
LRWTTTFRDGHNKIASTPTKSKNQRAGIGSDYVREQLPRWIDAILGVQSLGGALHPVRVDIETEVLRFRAKRDAYFGFRNAARHRKRSIIAVSTICIPMCSSVRRTRLNANLALLELYGGQRHVLFAVFFTRI